MLEKLIIIAINLLICYLIIKINYAKLLLITKLIFIDIKFEVSKETNCIYDGFVKPGKKTNPS